jgi:UDP-glucose 4-epimerase
MKSMKILVTGGAGYVGTPLVDLLCENPQVSQVVVYDNLSRPNYNLFIGAKKPGHAKLRFIKGELLDSRRLRNALKDIDVVYHLAARVTTPFANTDAHFYDQVNNWGTAELVYALEERPVKKVIFTSSAGVYGSSSKPVDESFEPDPKSFYGISKLKAEEHIRRLNSKMTSYVFRCGNVYGYNRSMRFDAVINKFIFEANFEKRITIHGDGDQARSFIHADLIGHALANALHADLPSGTYNLVDKTYKVMDVVDAMKQLIPELEFILINQYVKLNELNIKRNDRVNQALGIANETSLKNDLAESMKRFRF